MKALTKLAAAAAVVALTACADPPMDQQFSDWASEHLVDDIAVTQAAMTDAARAVSDRDLTEARLRATQAAVGFENMYAETLTFEGDAALKTDFLNAFRTCQRAYESVTVAIDDINTANIAEASALLTICTDTIDTATTALTQETTS